jgi:phytoene dehydrogenase-like protein
MNATWDAVIVGSGVGALVCAAYLAADGARVLVLEQHDVAGGSAHVFRRRRAYEFDVGVHYLGDCGPDGLLPAILSGLGIGDRVPFRPMDQDCFDRVILPSVTIDVPAGWDRYRQRLKDAMPAEAAGLDRFIDRCQTVAGLARHSLITPHDEVMDLIRSKSADLRWSRRTLANLFDDCGLSARARTVLAAQSGNYGAPPSGVLLGTHASMIDHYMRGAYYPAGGGQVLVASLVEVLEAHGGELRTRCEVRRILIEGGRAAGVELADGTSVRAPLIVSNADYRKTILELCGGRENFPAALVAKTQAATMRHPLAVLYVALDSPLTGLRNANVWWWRGEDVEEAYARLWDDGEHQEVPFVFVSFASTKDPEAPVCPPGQTNFQVMTLCPPGRAPWGIADDAADGKRYRREPAYKAAKQRFVTALLDAAELAIGPFRDRIVHLEASTPLTNERYTLSSGGTPYGMANWGTVGQRPDTATSVPGLYIVGPNTRYGSGIAGVALSGIATAGQCMGRPLLREVYAGDKPVSSANLPPRPAEWDPLLVSRGIARRNARGLARLGR